MEENRLGEKLLGCALNVHKQLGPGLLESAHESCLTYELEDAGLACRRQVVMPVTYAGRTLDQGYRLDLLVENLVVVEIKAVEKVMEGPRS